MAKTFQDLLNEGQAKVLGIVSIVPMDDWNTDTQYQKLNLVRHNGAAYLAKGGSKNVEPGVTQDWQSSWMLVYLDGILSPDGTYPNLTAGRVMHALAWGNKNYDGSSAQTITAADLGLADVYKPQGSIAFASQPATPNESNYGYVWNITNDFTTDSRFIEGAGKSYSAGTNVGVIEQDGAYYYDIFGAFVDLSNYATVASLNAEITRAKAAEQANATAAANAQTTANAKYTKPSGGIPKSDLAQSVQDSLDKANSALQSAPVTSVNGKTGAVSLSASDVGAATSAQGAEADQAATDIANIKNGTTVVGTAEVANALEHIARLDAGSDLNDCIPEDAEQLCVWSCWSTAAIPQILNIPNGLSHTFYVTAYKTWRGDTEQKYRVVQTLYECGGDNRIFNRAADNSGGSTVFPNWKQIVYTDGSYPTLGAGHLPNNYIYAGGSSDPKWYKIATISNAPNLAAAGLLLSINGIFATQDSQYAAETGQIEFDAANASGTYSCSATLNYGNINTNNVCVVQNGSTAELYYHFDSDYQAILVTVMSFYGGSTASYKLTKVGVSAAPSNAIYAVNRNFARPLFIATQTQAKTPTVNTDMTLDGGVSPDGSIIGDEVIFYCTSGSSRYTCTGKIKSISGTTPTVTITGVVTQTDIVDTTKPHLYLHRITVTADGVVGAARFMWLSTSSAAYTLTSLCGLIYSSTREGRIIPATGSWSGDSTRYYMTTYFQATSATTAIVYGIARYISGNNLSYASGTADVESISDTVTQLF